ncbi:MAG: fatty acid desaturase [Bacteroidetes bacterium]|nr:fatty acid desaturase [Bacteroidota bacterium]
MNKPVLKKQNKSFIHNYVVWNSFMVVVIIAMLFVFISWNAAVAFLIQMLLANFLLEYVNYIEHYGLIRKEDERVREMHSWQSDKVVSRFFLVDLSRHADHHYFASKHYHTLQTYDNSPKLPGGYVQMIYYALIPPIWFGATHKILRAQGYID